MLTILLTFLLWLILNTVAQTDLKRPLDKPTETVYTKKVRRRYTQQHIESINLLELLP